jgi:glycosyltransferase involved in cell wall biosynthesis
MILIFMAIIKNELDLCYISYSDLTTDARSRNFISSFKSLGLNICTLSIADAFSNQLQEENNFTIKINSNARLLFNWIKFIQQGKKYGQLIKAKIYFAADLYSLPVAIALAKKDDKVIYDSREIFSALGTLQNSSFKQFALAQLEQFLITKVDKFVVSGELDKEFLQKHFHTNKPFFVVKNLPAKSSNCKKNNYLREKFSIPKDKLILIYQGVILEGRGILPMFTFLKENDEFIFCIIGTGKSKQQYIDIASSPLLQNKVFFHNAVEYSKLSEITASADIGIALIEPITFSYRLALPNKLFEYIQAGLPVLTSDLPAMKDVIDTFHCGLTIPEKFSNDTIKKTLENLKSNYSYFANNALSASKFLNFESQYETIKTIIS